MISIVSRVIFVLVLYSAQTLNGQIQPEASPESLLMDQLNRVLDSFAIVEDKMIDTEEFAPTATQKEEFRKLRVRYQDAMKQIYGLDFSSPAEERIRVMKNVLKTAENCLKETTEQILLPHQQKLLHAEKFTRMLQMYQGDYIRLIQNHFHDLFEFTDEQMAKIRELVKESDSKIQELIEERTRKQREIVKKTQHDFDAILSDDQRKIIEKITGREFPPKKN